MKRTIKTKDIAKECLKELINLELKPYNTTYDNIIDLKDGKINNVDWYQYYTFKTEEEEKVFKHDASKIIQHYYPHISEKQLNVEVGMFMLQYGLKSEWYFKK